MFESEIHVPGGYVLKNFSQLELPHLLQILDWRNTDSVRVQLLDSSKIEKDDHLEYVRSLSGRVDRCYYYAEEDGTGIGVVSLTDIQNGEADLGLYKNPNLNKSLGRTLMKCVEWLAFENMKLDTLNLTVHRQNEKAIALYSHVGYQVEKETGLWIRMVKNNDK